MHGSPTAAITFNGRRIENRPPHEIARLGIVLVPERDKVFPNLTVAENLAAPFAPSASRAAARARSSSIILSRAALNCATASPACCPAASGRCWRSRSALICRPQLLLVDELSLGLAPAMVRGIDAPGWSRSAASSASLWSSSSKTPPSRWRSPTMGTCWKTAACVLDGDTRAADARIGDMQEFYLGQSAGSERRSYRDVKQYRRAGGGMAELGVEDLRLRFGGLVVLDDVSFAVERQRTVRADRAERRRQDQRAQLHQRHLPRARRDPLPRHATSAACRRMTSRGWALRAPFSTANCFRK